MKEVLKCLGLGTLVLIAAAAVLGFLGLIIWGILNWFGPVSLVYLICIFVYFWMCFSIYIWRNCGPDNILKNFHKK